MRHILSVNQFTPEYLQGLFKAADDMRKALAEKETRPQVAARQQGRIVATLFYEPSTRTRLSFESAAQRVGAGVISTENARESSSSMKGESLEDTIRTVARYSDVIVLRHSEDDAAERAASVSAVPIINAGAGKGEHPTQALLDLYTIWREKGRTDHLKVVIGGDLKHGCTARSLAQLLSQMPGNEITFVSASELQMEQDVKDYLNAQGAPFTETDELLPVLADADVVYWTRLQKERLTDPSQTSNFSIGRRELVAMKPDALIMHPLPRTDELNINVDQDPRAKYFDQVQNGLYIRMALLDQLLES